MSDFSIYKSLEFSRVSSNKDIANAAQVVSQSHQRAYVYSGANIAAALAETVIGQAPYAGNVPVINVAVTAASVANTTDYNVLTLSKRTGNGSAVVVATANLANVATTAFVPIAFTVANAANAVVAKNDILTLTNTKTGNGAANAAVFIVAYTLEDTA